MEVGEGVGVEGVGGDREEGSEKFFLLTSLKLSNS